MRIRALDASDAAGLAPLCTQLGYPATPADVARRLGTLSAAPDHAILGAVAADGRLVGWIHVQAHQTLTADRYAEISGLVVDEQRRGSGVGRELVVAAEGWAAAHDCQLVRVRSNVVRSRAHHFYEQLGYERYKTSHVFDKRLSSGEAPDS